ncbi:MAG: 50S ribosomal protein L4 [Acidimicrobiia bacterium]|nr:50S ribosomal protein L4 [Acidimicrobiia bacterium]NNC42281.1 50S ribosomal protein L4 [Acidimicrobiia bacterium]NND13520.1 50S ribosomal protein L4 [Acidimicrobiia bacterium]
MADDISAKLFSDDGSSKGTVSLDPAIFGVEPNVALMHQVVTAQLAGARAGTHSTKTRSEVRGGGRKPWRQKGTGRARHGSTRSPIWVGGGVAHGPKPRDYSQRTPKKMKRKALLGALSDRAMGGQIRVVQGIGWETPKTSSASSLLTKMESGRKILLVLSIDDEVATRSFRNLPNVRLTRPGQLNTYDVLWSDTLVFTSDALESLSTPAAPEAPAPEGSSAAPAAVEPAETPVEDLPLEDELDDEVDEDVDDETVEIEEGEALADEGEEE